MSILEIKLVIAFYCTNTIASVNAALRTLDILERKAVTIADSDEIKFAIDFLEERGINSESI